MTRQNNAGSTRGADSSPPKAPTTGATPAVASTAAPASAAGETPTDSPVAATGTPRSVPARGTRKRVLGQGEGDYCIYEIVGAQHAEIPAGSLLPIPNVPRFTDTVSALKWLRNESGDLLAGKQVMVFRACEILHLQLQQKPTVVIQSKAKVTVNKTPEAPANG